MDLNSQGSLWKLSCRPSESAGPSTGTWNVTFLFSFRPFPTDLHPQDPTPREPHIPVSSHHPRLIKLYFQEEI